MNVSATSCRMAELRNLRDWFLLRHTLNILGNQKFLKPYDLNKKKNLDLVKLDSENANDEEYRAKCFL